MDAGPEAAVRALNELAAQFGAQLLGLRGVQFALPHVAHRFLLAESGDALYITFMVQPLDLCLCVGMPSCGERLLHVPPAG